MTTHRRAILSAFILLPVGAAFAQTAPSKRTAVGGSSAPLPRSSPATKTKGAVAHTSGPRPRGGPSISQLGSVGTASPAESFALSGNLAYVCDDNEVSVVDITNPQAPQVVATALSGLFQQA